MGTSASTHKVAQLPPPISIDAAMEQLGPDADGWWALLTATDRGDAARVGQLLSEGADPNRVVVRGEHPHIPRAAWPGHSALLLAARKGSAAIVSLLLAHGADASRRTDDGATSVLLAAHGNHLKVLRALGGVSQHDLDPNAATSAGVTPCIVAAKNGFVGVIRYLATETAADLDKTDQYGRSPVFWAAELGQVAALKALVAYGADINLADADGTTPLYQASQSGHVESVKCLASAGASINLVDRTSWTPLLVAAYNGHAEVVRCLVGLGAEIDAATNTGATATFYAAYMGHLDILVKLCNAGADLNKPNAHHQTPLYIAVFSHRTRVAVQLLQCGADPNIPDANGTTPLKSAHDAHDSELVATLMVRGADSFRIYSPLVTKCIRGDARKARQLAKMGAEVAVALPPLHAAVLLGDAARLEAALATAAPSGEDPLAVDAAGMMAAYYAVELGEPALVRRVLVAAGADPALLAYAREAVEATDAGSSPGGSGSEYVPGSRYQRLVLSAVTSGLTETCRVAKRLVEKYLGTVAACLYFERTGGAAFATLKAACKQRLDTIARPLDAMYADQGLGHLLGTIGADWHDLTVRLDDPGLLPIPSELYGSPKESTMYEDFLMYFIWLVSLALDAGFSAKLNDALRPFGDRVTVKAAPVKNIARMRNKLASPLGHEGKDRPRPTHNIDTIRAGVVVKDAHLVSEVFDAIGAAVGPWLRVKNSYRRDTDAAASFGYRAILGNLKHASGVTCGALFGEHNSATWDALRDALPGQVDRQFTSVALTALRSEELANAPVNLSAEVQVIYEPYLTAGRIKSHLHYKVVRCGHANELIRDSASRFTGDPKAVAAHEAVRREVAPRCLSVTDSRRTLTRLEAELADEERRTAKLRGEIAALKDVVGTFRPPMSPPTERDGARGVGAEKARPRMRRANSAPLDT